MPRIETVTKGSRPTLLEAEKANELIKAINCFANAKGINGIKVTVSSDWSKFEIELEDGLGEEITLDVVGPENKAQTVTLLTRPEPPAEEGA